jgi:hypothetical protein
MSLMSNLDTVLKLRQSVANRRPCRTGKQKTR